MIKKLGLITLFFLVIFFVFLATRPNTFYIERSREISAPVVQVFPLVNDLRVWAQWSPYEKVDPNMKKTYSENTVGQGAFMDWEGNSEAGAGRTTITESVPYQFINVLLVMRKPMEAENNVNFDFQENGDKTTVKWSMNGKVPFIAKIFHLFFDMDKMVGSQFESGLTELAKLAETQTP